MTRALQIFILAAPRWANALLQLKKYTERNEGLFFTVNDISRGHCRTRCLKRS